MPLQLQFIGHTHTPRIKQLSSKVPVRMLEGWRSKSLVCYPTRSGLCSLWKQMRFRTRVLWVPVLVVIIEKPKFSVCPGVCGFKWVSFQSFHIKFCGLRFSAASNSPIMSLHTGKEMQGSVTTAENIHRTIWRARFCPPDNSSTNLRLIWKSWPPNAK